MWNKILNPKTGRFVKVNGAIGKKILKKYIMMLRGGTSTDTNGLTDLLDKYPEFLRKPNNDLIDSLIHAFKTYDDDFDVSAEITELNDVINPTNNDKNLRNILMQNDEFIHDLKFNKELEIGEVSDLTIQKTTLEEKINKEETLQNQELSKLNNKIENHEDQIETIQSNIDKINNSNYVIETRKKIGNAIRNFLLKIFNKTNQDYYKTGVYEILQQHIPPYYNNMGKPVKGTEFFDEINKKLYPE